MCRRKKILILGLFVNASARKQNIRTSDDRIASMFKQNNIEVITSSAASSKIKRFLETVVTLTKERQKYDIAIVSLFGTWPSFLWQEVITRLLKLFDKKIILCIRGGSIPERIEQGATRFYDAMKRADALVAPSSYFGQYFLEKNYAIKIIENPVNVSAYEFCKKEKINPRIIWMRAFTDVYDPLMAIRVARRLAESYPDFQMVMAGKDGPLTQDAKALAKTYGLENKIIFPGYINMQQKQDYARRYDIYICTNKIDNTPVSLTEFMQFGLPIVSVNVGGIPYMIEDRVNGLLVNAGDDEAMYKKISLLIENQELAQSIITSAHTYVQQYNEESVLEKWQDLLAELEKEN